MKRRALGLWITALCLAASARADTPAFQERPATPALLKALQGGGYVLYIRHGDTDNSRADQVPPDLGNCNTQRVLNESGRQLMRMVGQQLRRAGVPVERVLFSPMCRTRESAEIAFPDEDRQVEPQLQYSANLTSEQKRPLLKAARRLLSTPPMRGRNLVLMAHAPNLADLFGYYVKPEGTVVVIKPLGQGHYEYLASIPPDLWPQLHPSP